MCHIDESSIRLQYIFNEWNGKRNCSEFVQRLRLCTSIRKMTSADHLYTCHLFTFIYIRSLFNIFCVLTDILSRWKCWIQLWNLNKCLCSLPSIQNSFHHKTHLKCEMECLMFFFFIFLNGNSTKTSILVEFPPFQLFDKIKWRVLVWRKENGKVWIGCTWTFLALEYFAHHKKLNEISEILEKYLVQDPNIFYSFIHLSTNEWIRDSRLFNS